MDRILKIAKREFVETAKTKMFILSIVLMPVIMVGAMLFSGYTQKKATTGARPTRTVATVVAADQLWSALDETFAEHNRTNDQRQIVIERHKPAADDTDALVKQLKQGVRKNDLDGLLVIVEDVVDGEGAAQFYTKRITDMSFYQNVQRMLNKTVANERMVARNLSPELISKLRRGVPLEQVDMSSGTEKEGNVVARLMVPFFFLFMMFLL